MKDLAIILVCWSISFLFSGIEAGLLTINPVRLRHQVKENKSAAIKLDRLLKNPERLFATVLLITNFTNILGLLVLTHDSIKRFGAAGFFSALLVAMPIYLFVLSLLPKSLFRRFPFRALARLAGLLEAASLVLWPLLEIGSWIGRIFMPRQTTRRLFAAREELKQLTAESEREGTLTANERALIHNIVDFRNVRARDVMTPLEKVLFLRPDATTAEALSAGAKANVDALPVITKAGEPVGIVNVLDVLFDQSDANSLGKYVRRIVVAQENEPAYVVIRRLRAARLGLAAIVDLKRNLAGIVTSEDLIRALVRST